MVVGNVTWWIGFTIVGIWLQNFMQGIDLLVAGFILCLQEERWVQTFWLGLLWIFIQEGTGSLAFGAGLLWYLSAVILFCLGRWLFEAENIFFILLIGLSMGAIHFVIMLTMASLQNYTVVVDNLAVQSAIQAVVLLPVWLMARMLRTRMVRHVHPL